MIIANRKSLTVAELIEKLQQYDPNKEVYIESIEPAPIWRIYEGEANIYKLGGVVIGKKDVVIIR